MGRSPARAVSVVGKLCFEGVSGPRGWLLSARGLFLIIGNLLWTHIDSVIDKLLDRIDAMRLPLDTPFDGSPLVLLVHFYSLYFEASIYPIFPSTQGLKSRIEVVRENANGDIIKLR